MPDWQVSDLIPASETQRPEPPRGVVALRLVSLWDKAKLQGLLYIDRSEQRAEHLGANIHALFPQCPVMVFPRWDCLPYDRSGPSREIMGRRASVLRRLAASAANPAAPLVIATPEALMQRVAPQHVWPQATFNLRVGAQLSVDQFRQFLDDTGYTLDALVDEPGEAAFHGQVIDLFPGGALGPVRIELDEGRIAAIRSYDPATQRTVLDLSEAVIDAASEMIATEPAGSLGLVTLLDYMPDAAVFRGAGIAERGSDWFEQIQENWENNARLPGATTDVAPALLSPERLYMTPEEWRAVLVRAKPLAFGIDDWQPPRFVTLPNPNRAYRDFIAEQHRMGRRVLLTAAEERDLALMFRRAKGNNGSRPVKVTEWREVAQSAAGSLMGLLADFERGFGLDDLGVTVIAAADLLGSRARHAIPMFYGRDAASFAGEVGLQIDAPVVHLDHGIGVLRGIETVTQPGAAEQDTLRLEYAGGDVLMVPVREIGAVWAYGTAPDGLTLDRLNSDTWQKRKTEVEAEIGETAQTLAGLVKEHKARVASKLMPASRAFERFAAGFPFVLTPDQNQAVDEVLADLNSGHPMDRLLCGDVGFGKTEVALRAVAAAVLSGKQAAVMVPTTVLARQHLNTFRRRFAPLAVRVELLSRLATSAEAREIKKGLRDGSVQIAIGTHALAGKDIRFNDLGLLVIDEEQRFGTRIKQKLRHFAEGVHVLTMSATPIPRTLQRAMVGLQTFSALETPPSRRLPVRTVLAAFDPGLLREALAYERRRGGQSFVVCPRIEDLEPMAERLRAAVPQLRTSIVHGKMPASEVDEAMVGFADGRGDILLTTNIIETGLDIPRANTIVIWRPDRFGLAQLHQLRGRVGRSRRRGLAYLLTDPSQEVPTATQKRLKTLAEADRLGAGFAISRRDLELRGGGDLLGETQVGHIKSIGAELYHDLLQRAMRAPRDAAPRNPPAEIAVDLPTGIASDYVSEPEARINLYARLARLTEPAEIDAFSEEVEGRFGGMPEPAHNLLELKRLAMRAGRLGIGRVDAGPAGIAFTFSDDETAWRASAGQPATADMQRNGSRLVLRRETSDSQRKEALRDALEALEHALTRRNASAGRQKR